MEREINEVLGNLPLFIEYVGSISVKDLATKTIIDIDIVINSSDDLKEIK